MPENIFMRRVRQNVPAEVQDAFKWLRFDRAAVMAFVTFIILTILSILYSRVYFKEERS